MSRTATDAHAFLHDVVEEWLRDPDVTIACGQWLDGAISEIQPRGRAVLMPARYEGRFAGVREIRLRDSPHHLHIDLGRVHQVCYAVAPSVCFGFKPALEVRLLVTESDGRPSDRWVVAFAPARPYQGDEIDETCAGRFFARLKRHAARAPGQVSLKVDPTVASGPYQGPLLRLLRLAAGTADGDWDQAVAALLPPGAQRRATPPVDPVCLPLLRDALRLRDASLVIFRNRTLVEFQTEKLDGVHRYAEGAHVSWQIGGLRDHHCHLALEAVVRVLFSAEPVSCQGGGINYTVWFLTAGPAGNPWRPDGYFSVVLNRPYSGNRPRMDVIGPVLALHDRYRHEPWVAADERFLEILARGVPDRQPAVSLPVPHELP